MTQIQVYMKNMQVTWTWAQKGQLRSQLIWTLVILWYAKYVSHGHSFCIAKFAVLCICDIIYFCWALQFAVLVCTELLASPAGQSAACALLPNLQAY